MKAFLFRTLALFLCLVPALGATVTGTLKTANGSAYVGTVTFTPDPSISILPPAAIASNPVRYSVTNGTFSVSLYQGDYTVKVGTSTPFVIRVPSGASSYNITELVTSGALPDVVIGFPKGGTVGQALVKLSTNDFDVAWGNVASGSGADTVGYAIQSALAANAQTAASVPSVYLSPVSGAGGFGSSDNTTYLNYGNRFAVGRDIPIVTAVEFYFATGKSAVTNLTVQVWRRNYVGGTAYYHLVGSTENLIYSVTESSLNKITLAKPLVGIRKGDLVGWSIGCSSVSLPMTPVTVTDGSVVSVYKATSSLSDDMWNSGTGNVNNQAVPIQLYGEPSFAIAIGDSLTAGSPGTRSLAEAATDTYLATYYPERQWTYFVEQALGISIQNQGISSQTSAQMLARFTNDVVNLKPKLAFICAGSNDIAGSVNKATWLANMLAMIDSAIANGIYPVVVAIPPRADWCTAPTYWASQARRDWNDSLRDELSLNYANAASYVNLDETLGVYYSSGDDGNLDNLNPSYNADGIHCNVAGYTAWGNKVADFVKTSLAKPVADVSVTGVNWDDVLGKPSTFAPALHSITSGTAHSFPGGTTTFLRADGTFATPAGGGGAALENTVIGPGSATVANRIAVWSDTTGTNLAQASVAVSGLQAASAALTALSLDPAMYQKTNTALTKITESGGYPLWNGSTWPGGTDSGDMLATNYPISVKDFGAVGNGSTDDTLAVSNAIVTASSLGRGVYLPAGTYIIKNIALTNLALVQIDGPEATLKLRADPYTDYIASNKIDTIELHTAGLTTYGGGVAMFGTTSGTFHGTMDTLNGKYPVADAYRRGRYVSGWTDSDLTGYKQMTEDIYAGRGATTNTLCFVRELATTIQTQTGRISTDGGGTWPLDIQKMWHERGGNPIYTTTTAHGLSPGQSIRIRNMTDDYSGTVTVLATPTSTTFTITKSWPSADTYCLSYGQNQMIAMFNCARFRLNVKEVNANMPNCQPGIYRCPLIMFCYTAPFGAPTAYEPELIQVKTDIRGGAWGYGGIGNRLLSFHGGSTGTWNKAPVILDGCRFYTPGWAYDGWNSCAAYVSLRGIYAEGGDESLSPALAQPYISGGGCQFYHTGAYDNDACWHGPIYYSDSTFVNSTPGSGSFVYVKGMYYNNISIYGAGYTSAGLHKCSYADSIKFDDVGPLGINWSGVKFYNSSEIAMQNNFWYVPTYKGKTNGPVQLVNCLFDQSVSIDIDSSNTQAPPGYPVTIANCVFDIGTNAIGNATLQLQGYNGPYNTYEAGTEYQVSNCKFKGYNVNAYSARVAQLIGNSFVDSAVSILPGAYSSTTFSPCTFQFIGNSWLRVNAAGTLFNLPLVSAVGNNELVKIFMRGNVVEPGSLPIYPNTSSTTGHKYARMEIDCDDWPFVVHPTYYTENVNIGKGIAGAAEQPSVLTSGAIGYIGKTTFNSAATAMAQTNMMWDFTLSSNPANGATFGINGQTLTWRDTPSAATDLQRGASASASAANLHTWLSTNRLPPYPARSSVSGAVVSIAGFNDQAFSTATASAGYSSSVFYASTNWTRGSYWMTSGKGDSITDFQIYGNGGGATSLSPTNGFFRLYVGSADTLVNGSKLVTKTGANITGPAFVYLKNVAGVWYVEGGGITGGTTNMMVSTITYSATLAPTFAISGLSTTAASCRRVTFRCTLTGNVTTVSAPAGTLIDGDTMVIEFIQDATGSRTITGWDSKYAFGSDITGIVLTTTASKRDFATFVYNSTADKWYCTGFVRGY